MNYSKNTKRKAKVNLTGYLLLLGWLAFVVSTPRIATAGDSDTGQSLKIKAHNLLPLIEDILINAGADSAIEIELSQPENILPAGIEKLSSKDFLYTNYSKNSGRFVIRSNHKDLARPVTITGFARIPILIPVLKTNIERNTAIEDSNIEWIETNTISTKNHITNISDLQGMIARRPLRANAPLRHNDVQRPVLISRGALVTMIYEKAGLTLSYRGIAQDNGSQGDIITVQNPKSEREIKAMVTARNQVHILSSNISGSPLSNKS